MGPWSSRVNLCEWFRSRAHAQWYLLNDLSPMLISYGFDECLSPRGHCLCFVVKCVPLM